MRNLLKQIQSDQTGSTLIEFALLAPALITAIIGVFQVGVWVQNYNAVRNLAMDSARFAAVEYQKGTQISTDDLALAIQARGVGNLYNLENDRLEVTVNEVTTRISGVKELDIDITYTSPDWLAFVELDALNLTYSRPVFVPV